MRQSTTANLTSHLTAFPQVTKTDYINNLQGIYLFKFFPHLKQYEAETKMTHLSIDISLVPAGHLFGCSIGGGLVSCLVPSTLTFYGSLSGSGPVDSFQVPRFGLLCQLLTNLPLHADIYKSEKNPTLPYNNKAQDYKVV